MMGHWAHECRSKPKKEQAHVTQDEEEGSLLLMTATLTYPKASSMSQSMVETLSSVVEIELKEEKVYAHLDEENENDVVTWIVDTGATNHMFGCRVAFMKLNMAVLDTMRFSNDLVAWIEGRMTDVHVKEWRVPLTRWFVLHPSDCNQHCEHRAAR
jgi:hypothetical protein